MSINTKVLFLPMGGSIEGVDSVTGKTGGDPEWSATYDTFVHHKLPNCFNVETNCKVVRKKDSSKLDSYDRESLLGAIVHNFRKHDVTRFIVPHGTATIEITRNYLLRNLPNEIVGQVSIALVGAEQVATDPQSDAPWKVGFALGSILHQKGIILAVS
ncbi:MAG: asparaginase domain-containing protein [bacterium]|nr:asparaginase domain-containing protein [bacterium]